jgi:hypothetical protein
VLVPLRGVLESLGARVRYVPEERRIDVTQNRQIVVLRIGDRDATGAGQKRPAVGGTAGL